LSLKLGLERYWYWVLIGYWAIFTGVG